MPKSTETIQEVIKPTKPEVQTEERGIETEKEAEIEKTDQNLQADFDSIKDKEIEA